MTTRCRSSSRHRARDGADGTPPPLRHPGHVRAMAIAQTEFALKLYKALVAQSGGRSSNVHFSPLRVHHALTMVYAGSRYETAELLRTALCLRSVDGDAAVSLAYADVTRSLAIATATSHPIQSSSSSSTQMYLATRLYVPLTHCGLLDQYVTSLRQHYGSDVAKVPFHTDRERACREIDQWVEESTEQTVRDLVETPLATFVSLVLASVVFFRSPWDKSFAGGKAELADFHNAPDDVVRVMTLKSRGRFRHGVVESVGCRIVEVRFADERYSLLLIQPSSDDRTLDAVEEALTADVLLDVDEHLNRCSRTVKVSVPRFGADQGSLSLGKALADERLMAPAGISAAFARGKVNLSGISGNNNLHLSHVVHKVRFEMDHFHRTKVPPRSVEKKTKKAAKQQQQPPSSTPATELPPVANNGPSANGEQVTTDASDTLPTKNKKKGGGGGGGKATDGNKENVSMTQAAHRKSSGRHLQFDRPFMYAVRDRHLGMLLLLGCVRKLTGNTAPTCD